MDDTFSDDVLVRDILQSTTYSRQYETEVMGLSCVATLNITDIYGSKPNFGGCISYVVSCRGTNVSSGT